jgi:hypothetical protein
MQTKANKETAVINTVNPGEVETMLKDFTEVPEISEPLNNEEPAEIEGKKTRKKRDKNVINSSIISGALFLLFIDLVIPNLISVVNNRVSRSKIGAEMLKLTTDQRKELEPLAEEVARLINIKGNPVMILSLSLGAIYLSNFMVLKGTK